MMMRTNESREAWKLTKFVVDRFHKKGHTIDDDFCMQHCVIDDYPEFKGRFNTRYCTSHLFWTILEHSWMFWCFVLDFVSIDVDVAVDVRGDCIVDSCIGNF